MVTDQANILGEIFMAQATQVQRERKRAKYCAIFWSFMWTAALAALLTYFVPATLTSVTLFNNESISLTVLASSLFLTFWVPFSLLLSMYLMWSSYLRGLYRKTNFYWALPIFSAVFVVILNEA